MTSGAQVPSKAAHDPQDHARLFYFNGGFFTQKQVRRILELAGFELTLGKPRSDDLIAVWGKSPTHGRGGKIGAVTGAGLVHIEDALLRSLHPGRVGSEPPVGLTIDRQRPYFDSAGPSDLETLLAQNPLDDAALLTRAKHNIARIQRLHLSKYNDFDLTLPPPEPGYVLVIDQTRDDASIAYGGGSVAAFREMLVFAQQDHPAARILIKSHPETVAGARVGHFGPEHLTDRMELVTAPYSPYALLEGAIAVYTVSSGLGFEAIMAGHRPVVFGQPFYAGWGLTEDHQPVDRRQRQLTRAQLFAGAMMLYPRWYDPYRDRLCALEGALDTLEALTRAHREDRAGHVALGMSLWKRKPLQQVFGRSQPLIYAKTVEDAQAQGRAILAWASKAPEGLAEVAAPLRFVEDGFLRSRGLGADLIPPLSVVTDRQGIYYDPTRASDLEDLINAAPDLPPDAVQRAEALRRQIIRLGVSKYNLGGHLPKVNSDGREIILVPGQVEDDASILKGAGDVATNRALVARVRRDFPDAYLVFKPHPDVEAGLRDGQTPEGADLLAEKADPLALLAQCDRVATITSLLGFEALMRGVPVTCYGMPFYAGWGLTDDRMEPPSRRRARPSVDALVHAALIAYPRYFDPVTQAPCPPEVAVERLAQGALPSLGFGNRLLAKLQGLFAGHAGLWRK